jgi:hypothetical protein
MRIPPHPVNRTAGSPDSLDGILTRDDQEGSDWMPRIVTCIPDDDCIARHLTAFGCRQESLVGRMDRVKVLVRPGTPALIWPGRQSG